MFNRIILVGRLTADPESRVTPSGTQVVKFTLAVQRPFADKSGERATDFIDCQAWRNLAETCVNHLRKGYMVAVEGRLQVRSYKDKEDKWRKVSEVVLDNVRFLDRGKQGSQNQQGAQGSMELEDEQFDPDNLPF
jgi:single-strand DNA-binding protein